MMSLYTHCNHVIIEETKTAEEFHSKLQLNVTPYENDNASFIMLVMRVVVFLEARNVTHVVNVL